MEHVGNPPNNDRDIILSYSIYLSLQTPEIILFGLLCFTAARVLLLCLSFILHRLYSPSAHAD